MKALLVLGLVSNLCLCVACSKDNPSGPTEDPNLILAQDVDGGGATLTTDGLIVVVPPGALSESRRIHIYLEEDESPLDNFAATGRLRIEGLPRYVDSAIDLYLKVTDTVGDSGWVVFCEHDAAPGDNSNGTSFVVVPAADSSGYLRFQYPPEGDFGSRKTHTQYEEENIIFSLFGLYDSYYFVETEHFKFVRLKEQAENLHPVLIAMETAYDSLETWGVDFSKIPYLIYVSVVPLYSPGASSFTHLFPKGLSVRICLSYDEIGGATDPTLKTLACSQLCRILPHLYLNKDRWTANQWLQVAFECWGMLEFGDVTNHCGANFPANQSMPFLGIREGITHDKGEQLNYGRGMVSMIKYLAGRYDKYVFANALQHMKDYGAHPFEGFDRATADGLDTWWPDYLKELIEGNLCPFDADALVSGSNGTFVIDDITDTLANFTVTYSDLAAKAFYVGLAFDQFQPSDKLRFTASAEGDYNDELDILLFSYKNQQLTFLGNGTDFYAGDLAARRYNGENLVAVVATTHYNRTYFYPDQFDVKLDMRYIRDSGPSFEFCKIKIAVKPEYEDYDGNTYWSNYPLSYIFAFNGTSTNGVFTGIPEPIWHGQSATGTMTINFDPATYDVSSFSVDVHTYGLGVEYEVSLEGTNIPYANTSSWVECGVSGAGTCDHITSFGHFALWDVNNYKWTTLKSFACEDASHYITIELYDTD